MTVHPPFDVFREQLSFLSQGLALWSPKPLGSIYDKVSIGDVGYMSEGAFIRMFNVMLPWDDESNRRLGEPASYEPLKFDDRAISRTTFDTVDYYSSSVSREENAIGVLRPPELDPPDVVTYRCRGRGAFLSLPNGGHREDALPTKAFKDYIQNHVGSWFHWAQNNKLDVERMVDLVFVTGCTLVTSWAAAAFVDHTIDTEISLECKTSSECGTKFFWRNIQGPVVHHNSVFDPQNPSTIPDQCVFIRGLRAKRTLFFIKPLRAAAEPRPDDPDDRKDDERQMTQVRGKRAQKKCHQETIAEETIAIAHVNGLQEVETLTADAMESVLRDKQIPLLVENAAILRDPLDIEPPVFDEKKATFYAAVELDGQPDKRPLYPVLTKYLPKLEMTESLHHDYSFPREETTVIVPSDSRVGGVAVQEVLPRVHEDFGMPFPSRELSILDIDKPTAITLRL